MKALSLGAVLLVPPLMFSGVGEKKSLDHSAYDLWRSIAGQSISTDGRWVVYSLEPGEGDARLILFDMRSGRGDTIERASGGRFSDDSKFVAFTVKPVFAEVRKAKIAKKKTEDLPKDTLGILLLGSSDVVKIPRVKSFKLPEKGAGWIAYQLEKEPAKPDTGKATKKPDGHSEGDLEVNEKEAKAEKGTALLARELSTGTEYMFPFVGEYLFTKDGSKLLFTSTGDDSTKSAGVFLFDTRNRKLDTLSIGKGNYKQLAWDEGGTQAAYVADRDTTKSKQRYYALHYWTAGQDSAIRLADTLAPGMRKGWFVSENGRVSFSKDGTRLFFGTAPVPAPDDTTFNEEETPALDIWNWSDPLLQTQQVKDLEREKKRTYLAVVNLGNARVVQLADGDVPDAEVGSEGNAGVALGWSDLPYRASQSWLLSRQYDVYLIEVATGSRTKVLEKLAGYPNFSPGGKYISWYDKGKKHWFVLDVAARRTVQVTGDIKVPLYDELFDQPDDPPSHGQLGWTEQDEGFLVYDRFDIWLTDPAGKNGSRCVTAGAGRKLQTRLRYVRQDPEERFLKRDGILLLRGFNEKEKSAGFFRARLGSAEAPEKLVMEACDFSIPVKAKRDSVYLLSRSTFVDFPDLHVCGPAFTHMTRISTANPQQKDYRWGTVELINWKAPSGVTLEGLLYRPENMDPRRKSPMVVYYYERNSDGLHRYWAPSPSRSTINPSFYASRGYVVFIPDIRYTVGYPGKSALDAVVSGTRAVLKRGFVDSTKVGLQGQSWGGYETAYIVTRTSMFAAAGAGAAVVNMTSAYGGIRWESGWVREWQYEKSQSRIGGTLWEKLNLYIENSPLFKADKITTPLLLMNNDNDGAVPWYQGIEFFTALRRLGKPVWMLVYNGEEHNLTKWKNRKDLSIRMAQFFDHYLKNEPMPAWMARGRPATDKQKTMGYELVD